MSSLTLAFRNVMFRNLGSIILVDEVYIKLTTSQEALLEFGCCLYEKESTIHLSHYGAGRWLQVSGHHEGFEVGDDASLSFPSNWAIHISDVSFQLLISVVNVNTSSHSGEVF